MTPTPARFILADLFPPHVIYCTHKMHQYRGASTTIADIPWSATNKRYLVGLCIRRNMEAVESDGNGTKAAKRSARLHDGIKINRRPINLFPPSKADIEAERITEGKQRQLIP